MTKQRSDGTPAWHALARIISHDPTTGKLTAEIDGERRDYAYPRLAVLTGLNDAEVAIVLEDDEHIQQIHPGQTSIDAVSLSIMRMLKEPMAALDKAWRETTTMAPKQVFPQEDGTNIEYSARRYHWNGINKGLIFGLNEIQFNGETPQAALVATHLKKLRAVVDHPGIPGNAIVTGAWSRNGMTGIQYDAEDVDMEEVVGPISRLLKNADNTPKTEEKRQR